MPLEQRERFWCAIHFATSLGPGLRKWLRDTDVVVCTPPVFFPLFCFFAREYNAFNDEKLYLSIPGWLESQLGSLNVPALIVAREGGYVPRACLSVSFARRHVRHFQSRQDDSESWRLECKGGHLLQCSSPSLFLLLVSLVAQICFLSTTNDRLRPRERERDLWFCN